MARRRGHGRWLRWLAGLALLVLLVAVVLVAGAGPGYRLGLISLGTAFELLRYGVFAALGAAALGLISLGAAIRRRRLMPGLVGFAVLLGTVGLLAIPFLHWQQARQVPPIHDITTDPDDPPAFEALAEARRQAPNALAYPGEEVARQQRQAYPDIQPLLLDAPLADVFAAAEAEVLAFGWEPAESSEYHRLEATAVTTWFGFQDDVVIRLREEDDKVRVDMRSASRIGRSDLGTNAARIRAYLDALERHVDAD